MVQDRNVREKIVPVKDSEGAERRAGLLQVRPGAKNSKTEGLAEWAKEVQQGSALERFQLRGWRCSEQTDRAAYNDCSGGSS